MIVSNNYCENLPLAKIIVDLKFFHKLAETIFFEIIKAAGDLSLFRKWGKNQISNIVLKFYGFLPEIFMQRVIQHYKL